MDHYSLEEWLKYVENELGEEEREAYENHLYTCDQCLEVYLEAMEEVENGLPAMPREDEFINLVMAQIADENTEELKELNEAGGQKRPSTRFERWFPIAFACLLLIGNLVNRLDGSKNKTENFEHD